VPNSLPTEFASYTIIFFIHQSIVNLGCLYPVVCVRSGDGGFYPSTQRHYHRLIYYYIILLCNHTQ
jgi:hypothetical protein